MPCGWIFSRLIAIASPFRIMRVSMIRGERGVDEPDYPPARHFSAAVSPDGRKPDGLPRPRPRIDGVARPPWVSRGVDRRAPFCRVRDHQLARDLHRDRCRAHQIHPLRHRRHLITLPQSADGGRPYRAARPPYPRPSRFLNHILGVETLSGFCAQPNSVPYPHAITVISSIVSIGKGVPVSDLEESLVALDARLQEVQRLGKAVVSAIARARTATKVGRMSELAKGLDEISRRISEARSAADGVSDDWRFDTHAYMSDGRFLEDLKAAAAYHGLSLFEKDGRIYCFPLLLRVDAQEHAVKIGRRLERRIRPRELARLLGAAQKRPQRFSESQFLELLYRTWRRLVGSGWRGTGVGPAVALGDLHETLTRRPRADYPS